MKYENRTINDLDGLQTEASEMHEKLRKIMTSKRFTPKQKDLVYDIIELECKLESLSNR